MESAAKSNLEKIEGWDVLMDGFQVKVDSRDLMIGHATCLRN